MGRRCAVANCNSTDQTILSHRFPRQIKNAEIWRKSLNINKIPINELITKYIVCSLHFKKSDYRNARSHHLNFTAIPQLMLPETVSEMKLLKADHIKIYKKPIKFLAESDNTENEINLNEIPISISDDITEDCTIDESIIENNILNIDNDQIDEKYMDTVYAKLNKNELIELLLNNETKINNLENEVNKYKTAHENIVKSMENFKQLMIIK